jgi:FtsZ-interacting cell division protein ZipA
MQGNTGIDGWTILIIIMGILTVAVCVGSIILVALISWISGCWIKKIENDMERDEFSTKKLESSDPDSYSQLEHDTNIQKIEEI